jgi:hypothetical protein
MENCVKHHIGIFLQLAALVLLPCLITFQLLFGFSLIVMPACLTIGIVSFVAGTLLRNS